MRIGEKGNCGGKREGKVEGGKVKGREKGSGRGRGGIRGRRGGGERSGGGRTWVGEDKYF